MSTSLTPHLELNGRPPTAEDLVHPALVNYGHFTAMQVRNGAVRGLALHLERLRSAHEELFGTELDTDRVRRLMRRSAGQRPDAYLRVTLFEVEPGVPQVMTATRPAIEASATAQSLTEVRYVRPFAHLKHVGSLAQIRYGLLAERAGFDDAVLVTPDELVAETTMANIGFVEGQDVVWPQAPCLHGITWQLLDAALGQRGRTVRTEPITLERAATFPAAFVANSIGVMAVARIGAVRFDENDHRVHDLADLYATTPWDVI